MPRIHITHEVKQLLTELLDEERITAQAPADPFGIDHDCNNPRGHHAIADCRDIVCSYCGKVFWQ